ncbi:AraC family transcriptional regulator [Hydrogenoanaerobacterium sp.]|uniref:helix-turn-helix domain-containing protein n=1 Tax=Hydrogenoanaerobacterium sp. TaxID=2953763 RepID=UPI00289AF03B|nr:AraC family transcriptional regulator [Hydrogenoanaerobacterium sp.]
MTSFFRLPQPPAEVAQDIVLSMAGVMDSSAKGSAFERKEQSCVFPFQGWLVLAVLAGEGMVTAGKQTFAVKQGELLITPCGGGMSIASGLECSFALLGGELAQHHLTGVTDRLGVQSAVSLYNPVVGTLRRICNSIELGAAVDGYWGCTKAFALLIELCALAEERKTTQIPPLVEQAAELIRTQYAYLSGIEELADRLGVTKHHLIREFSQHMRVPPGKYLSEVRLENAKLLLQSGKYTLEIVADMVGFAGANYFCKVFKKSNGMTPTEYAQSTVHRRPAGDLEKLEQMFYL